MITLKHKKTGNIYECLTTFPNNRGEITIWMRSKGYHSLPSIAAGLTIYEYLRENYPMLEIIKDNTFQ
jgi:hypothetical protein